jgi:heme exporter protein A
VIEARGLGKTYGSLQALEGVDFEISSGESVVVLGPNGAGKSTLLRLLATLTRPTNGDLRLFGAAATHADPGACRKRIGYLSHKTFLYDHLTGVENLLFYARLYSLENPGNVVEKALREARLWDRRDEPIAGFSRGMQQRLALARALLHRPDLILLDEPYTGLDRVSSRDLEARLIRERQEGRTTVTVTHDLEQGLAAADRVLLLLDGRLVLDAQAQGLDRGRLERHLTSSSGRPVPVGP